jgi:hypothetical protein
MQLIDGACSICGRLARLGGRRLLCGPGPARRAGSSERVSAVSAPRVMQRAARTCVPGRCADLGPCWCVAARGEIWRSAWRRPVLGMLPRRGAGPSGPQQHSCTRPARCMSSRTGLLCLAVMLPVRPWSAAVSGAERQCNDGSGAGAAARMGWGPGWSPAPRMPTPACLPCSCSAEG